MIFSFFTPSKNNDVKQHKTKIITVKKL